MGWLPEESHDGCQMRSKGGESLESLVAENSPEGVFDVGGYEHVALSRGSKGSEVIYHLVRS